MYDIYAHSVEVESHRPKVRKSSKLIGRESPKISRSKQDSEHITGLTAEIKLLKTFIKESYNNLTELRRAEQSTESEAQHQPIPRSSSYSVLRHPHGDSTSSALPPNSMSGSTAYERPTPSFPSPTSSAIKCDDEDSNSENSANDDDASSTKSDKQNDVYLTGPAGDTLNPEPLISRLPSQPRSSINNASKPSIHRESNLLFQMVPYRPNLPDPNRSDRLICGGQSSDSGTKLATHEATNSVRLLLDKWTASGSAPVSNILDEEVGREKNEASVAKSLFVLELTDIIFSVSWPISDGFRTLIALITPSTDGRYCQEPNLMAILVLHMTQDGMNPLVVSKMIICHRLRHGTIYSHITDIAFHIRRTSGCH